MKNINKRIKENGYVTLVVLLVVLGILTSSMFIYSINDNNRLDSLIDKKIKYNTQFSFDEWTHNMASQLDQRTDEIIEFAKVKARECNLYPAKLIKNEYENGFNAIKLDSKGNMECNGSNYNVYNSHFLFSREDLASFYKHYIEERSDNNFGFFDISHGGDVPYYKINIYVTNNEDNNKIQRTIEKQVFYCNSDIRYDISYNRGLVNLVLTIINARKVRVEWQKQDSSFEVREFTNENENVWEIRLNEISVKDNSYIKVISRDNETCGSSIDINVDIPQENPRPRENPNGNCVTSGPGGEYCILDNGSSVLVGTQITRCNYNNLPAIEYTFGNQKLILGLYHKQTSCRLGRLPQFPVYYREYEENLALGSNIVTIHPLSSVVVTDQQGFPVETMNVNEEYILNGNRIKYDGNNLLILGKSWNNISGIPTIVIDRTISVIQSSCNPLQCDTPLPLPD
ncbi:MAG: hypothetical protein N2505_00550 [Endomicrobia bacterium]|nr:hypothetical protein [Endomicrobiia bacterium]